MLNPSSSARDGPGPAGAVGTQSRRAAGGGTARSPAQPPPPLPAAECPILALALPRGQPAPPGCHGLTSRGHLHATSPQ
eukprot:14194692-Alexandrium_andersonii.AAC.1